MPQRLHGTPSFLRILVEKAEQTTKIKGMFVHPAQVAEIARRHPKVRKARLVVSGAMAVEHMKLQAELHAPANPADTSLAEALPNDGKVIEDARRYD